MSDPITPTSDFKPMTSRRRSGINDTPRTLAIHVDIVTSQASLGWGGIMAKRIADHAQIHRNQGTIHAKTHAKAVVIPREKPGTNFPEKKQSLT
ncbi:hypothetical protein OAL43_01235 [bacterium]|nr:hypothetical protein [bacterium]